MTETELPSGAKLEITPAPFAIAKALYMAVAEEMKSLKLDPRAEIDANFWKDIFCVGISSVKIEERLWECMKRATYNGLKIDKDTFEPIESRQDYGVVCFEVAKENILPFTKSLSAKYSALLGTIIKNPA